MYKELVNQIRASQLAVGSLAPDIQGKTPEGKEVWLSDLKGKYILLDFWASWCAPCRREFPFLKQAMAHSENYDNFIILSYSIDKKEKDWLGAIEKNGLTHKNWLHISDLKGWNSPAGKLFNVEAVPRTILLNPKGEVIAFDLRGEEMLEKVKRIMEGVEKYE
jgi:thiol-disulfide isomerase/thioredoxin